MTKGDPFIKVTASAADRTAVILNFQPMARRQTRSSVASRAVSRPARPVAMNKAASPAPKAPIKPLSQPGVISSLN